MWFVVGFIAGAITVITVGVFAVKKYFSNWVF